MVAIVVFGRFAILMCSAYGGIFFCLSFFSNCCPPLEYIDHKAVSNLICLLNLVLEVSKLQRQ